MRALQALVVIMGIALVVGSVVLGLTIARRMAKPGQSSGRANAAEPVKVTLPPGSHIDAMIGVGDRLAIETSGPGPRQAIYLIDSATGRVVATIGGGSAPP